MSNAKQFQAIIYTIHVLVWSYLFAAPFLFSRGEEHINWIRGIPHFSTTLSSCLLFYFTYLFLVPKLVFQKKKALQAALPQHCDGCPPAHRIL